MLVLRIEDVKPLSRKKLTNTSTKKPNNLLFKSERKFTALHLKIQLHVGETVLKFDLEEEFSIETALVVAEIYNKNGEWKFNAVAAGYQGGLEAICRSFGANV